MFPVTIEVVTADRSRRLDGFTSRSRLRQQTAGSDVIDVPRPVRGRRFFRPAIGR